MFLFQNIYFLCFSKVSVYSFYFDFEYPICLQFSISKQEKNREFSNFSLSLKNPKKSDKYLFVKLTKVT